MTPPPKKTDPTTFFEGENKKNLLETEIKEMISALTRGLSDLQKQTHNNHHPSGSNKPYQHHHSSHSDTDDDGSGVRIITLAGSNYGATMRGELDSDKSSPPLSSKIEEPTLDAYVNSNFQAINNSIMMGGSYSCNDPGVHLDITDYEPEQHHVVGPKTKHEGKHKGKKNEKGVSKSDHHSESNTE